MVIYNRKPVVATQVEDLIKMNLVDLEELNNSAAKFQQRRKKLTNLQKLIFDEFELYKAVIELYNGMYRLVIACKMKGVIKDTIPNKDVERNLYNSRFGMFS